MNRACSSSSRIVLFHAWRPPSLTIPRSSRPLELDHCNPCHQCCTHLFSLCVAFGELVIDNVVRRHDSNLRAASSTLNDRLTSRLSVSLYAASRRESASYFVTNLCFLICASPTLAAQWPQNVTQTTMQQADIATMRTRPLAGQLTRRAQFPPPPPSSNTSMTAMKTTAPPTGMASN